MKMKCSTFLRHPVYINIDTDLEMILIWAIYMTMKIQSSKSLLTQLKLAEMLTNINNTKYINTDQ